MEVTEVNVQVINRNEKITNEDFWDEYAEAYFEFEKLEKMERLREFKKAYEEIEDKNSFNAQYLEVLIDNLKSEV
ncbi:MAG: hypothetical protein ACFFAO_01395 [Candidatus Hermodarchaeota archaeon]